jgi:hypothetical protein
MIAEAELREHSLAGNVAREYVGLWRESLESNLD